MTEDSPITKICLSCGVTKPIAMFFRDNESRDGRKPRCKVCANVQWKSWYAKNGEKCRERARKYIAADIMANRRRVWKSGLKRTYGLTPEMFEQMKVDQGGCCACCGRPFVKTPHIDHCHKTNKVRALLCDTCNPGLGCFGDSIERLELAIKYLKKFCDNGLSFINPAPSLPI